MVTICLYEHSSKKPMFNTLWTYKTKVVPAVGDTINYGELMFLVVERTWLMYTGDDVDQNEQHCNLYVAQK